MTLGNLGIGPRRDRPKTKPMAILTPYGKQKLDDTDIRGDKGAIMWYLKENGMSSVQELADECGMSQNKIRDILKDLESEMFVQKVERS